MTRTAYLLQQLSGGNIGVQSAMPSAETMGLNTWIKISSDVGSSLPFLCSILNLRHPKIDTVEG